MERRDVDSEAFDAADRRIQQLLALHFGAGASAMREYLARATAAGIGWPLAADVTDESLVARLFVNAGVRTGARFHAEPDRAALVLELKRSTVNRAGPDSFGRCALSPVWG
jgi:transposase